MRNARFGPAQLALFVLAVTLAACGRGGSALDREAFPDPGSDSLVVVARLSKKSAGLGERVLVRVAANVAEKYTIKKRERFEEGKVWAREMETQAADNFVVDERGVVRTEETDGGLRIFFEIGLRALSFGDLRVPGVTLRVIDDKGESKTATTEELKLTVEPSLDEAARTSPAELDPTLVADAPSPPLWPWLLGLVVLGAFAALVFYMRRRARRHALATPAHRVPPDQQALARIRELERMLEREEIGAERLVVECSATLRRWLEDGLGEVALARTTDEFLSELRDRSRFSVAQQNRLQDFLRRTDLIKFAGQAAGLTECRELLASVRNFVEETRGAAPSSDAESSEHDEGGDRGGASGDAAGSGDVRSTEASSASMMAWISWQGDEAAPTTSGGSFFEWQQETFGFAFADPLFLLLLIPVALLFFWTRWRARPALGHASIGALAELPKTWRIRCAPLPRFLTFLSLAALVVACARPQTFERLELETQGIDILLALDLSSSMAARDLTDDPRTGDTRLDVVKRVAKDFVEGRASDRIGLISFARYPDLACPSTLDHEALLRFLEPLEHKRVPRRAGELPDPEDGTAIGAALALGVRRLANLTSKSRVIVLLSDGTETVNIIDPAESANLAKDERIRVYTIGAGRAMRDGFGRMHKQDFSILQGIAKTTGGEFFEAQSEAALAKVFERIDKLERSDLEDPVFAVDEEFLLLVLAGFSLLALATLLRLSLFVTLP